MSLPTPPTISEQAKTLEAALTAYAAQFTGAQVAKVQSLGKLWQEVYNLNDAPRFVFCCAGETSRGSFAQANTLHRVDRQWVVAILRGTGWIQDAAAGEVPLYDLLETVRDGLRSMLTLSEEFPIDYKNWKAIAPNLGPNAGANFFLEGVTIEFSTANDIPAILPPAPSQPTTN